MMHCALSEVLDRRFEHFDIVVSGNVLVQVFANALAVTHLAEDAAVRAGDTFNGIQAAVGIEAQVHGGLIVQIHILGGNLSVLCQLPDQAFLRHG